jgi:xanthine/uracil permease
MYGLIAVVGYLAYKKLKYMKNKKLIIVSLISLGLGYYFGRK